MHGTNMSDVHVENHAAMSCGMPKSNLISAGSYVARRVEVTETSEASAIQRRREPSRFAIPIPSKLKHRIDLGLTGALPDGSMWPGLLTRNVTIDCNASPSI